MEYIVSRKAFPFFSILLQKLIQKLLQDVYMSATVIMQRQETTKQGRGGQLSEPFTGEEIDVKC